MSVRCIFGCLVAFVGLVGLYACNVRRLKVRKRNAANFVGFAPIFLGCFAPAVALCGLSCGCCLYCFALVVCGFLLGCGWFSFPSDDVTKGKGAPCWRVLSSCVVCCVSLVPCALLLVFGFPRLGMPLYLPSFPSFALCRSCHRILRHPNRTRCYFAGLCSMYIYLLLFSYLFLLVGSCFLFPFRFCGLWACCSFAICLELPLMLPLLTLGKSTQRHKLDAH